MILRIIIVCYCLRYVSFALPPDPQQYETCLLGYMTDFQQWVDEVGRLKDHVDVEKAIDLSLRGNPVPVLQQKMLDDNRKPDDYVKYLSLARCRLSRVPPIFRMLDKEGRYLSDTLQYLSFFGNSFIGNNAESLYSTSLNATGRKEEGTWNERQGLVSSVWSSGFERISFPKLKELDLRNCSIQVLGENLFSGMGNLEALYLGENEIWYIDSTAFLGLNRLNHLDLSRNKAYDENGIPKNLITNNYFVFQHLKKLDSLDMSYMKLTQKNLRIFRSLGKNLKSLSICRTELTSLPNGIFNTTSLELLDVSGNSNILTFNHPLQGIEDSLMILNARETALSTMEIFKDFYKIEILALSANEINNVGTVLESMTNLLVLDLCRNRLTSWFDPVYSLAPKLKLLTITENSINVIGEQMIDDLKNIDYIAMGGNFLVCNCHAKDFFKMAFKNEQLANDTFIKKPKNPMHHLAYDMYNHLLKVKLALNLDCDEKCLSAIEDSGKFRIIDELPEYQCLKMPDGRTVPVIEVAGCARDIRDTDFDVELAGGMRKLLVLLIIPCILLPIAIMFIFRSHIRYFLITIRNSAMLSLINKNDVPETERIYNYDVFVSYCNEDRAWVLDHLLPHIETECSVSACLHERDFQVGLSILENIVSCMDRSRSIMLILSQRFLLSQWCQFEMHLAQHRLLETRREDLTLVLLEDIPRRLRPNTLHYLMLTKTYIVWPKDESERHLFWRRLKKTLISQKTKPLENVSLA